GRDAGRARQRSSELRARRAAPCAGRCGGDPQPLTPRRGLRARHPRAWRPIRLAGHARAGAGPAERDAQGGARLPSVLDARRRLPAVDAVPARHHHRLLRGGGALGRLTRDHQHRLERLELERHDQRDQRRPRQGGEGGADGHDDGVNLDFEPVSTTLRDQYTSFVRQLKAGLVTAGVGSYLTVCTMAGAASWATGYDLAGLTAAGAADAVFVMGYDYSWSGSARAGGVAPMDSPYILDVRGSVDDYLSIVPGGKIIWGVPYYGRSWLTTSNA